MLGRVRSLDEVTGAVSAVSTSQIREFYARNPVQDFSIVTLGPVKLTK